MAAILWVGACSESSPARPPTSSTEAFVAFSRGWALLEKGGSTESGWPTRIRRVRDSAEMALVPSGSFLMGAVAGDQEARADERPQHRVALSKSYYVDCSEVTVRQWRDFAAATGARVPDSALRADDMPIDDVKWDEALAYAKWVGAALPTEAQWERAARGRHENWEYPWGTEDDESRRNGPDEIVDAGALAEDGFHGLAPVRRFEPNEFGLYDMCGNGDEWCFDFYDPGYYATSPERDPTGPSEAREHVVRSGGWMLASATLLRSSSRHSGARDDAGFRCARALP